MNETKASISVGVSVHCNLNNADFCGDTSQIDSILGCFLISAFRDVLGYSITFQYYNISHEEGGMREKMRLIDDLGNGVIDIYAGGLNAETTLLKNAFPLDRIHTTRYGFTLRRPKQSRIQSFYSKPFRRSVWMSIFTMVFLAAAVFSILYQFELKLSGQPNIEKYVTCFVNEFFVAVVSCCQYSVGLSPWLLSRKVAYATFFIYAYLLHAFFSSAIVSNLLNKSEDPLTWDQVLQSDYNLLYIDKETDLQSNVNIIIDGVETGASKRLGFVEVVTPPDGVRRMKDEKVALFSDFYLLYGHISQTFLPQEVCDLIEVDFGTSYKYVWLSRRVRRKSLVNIVLRCTEAGLIKRFIKKIQFPRPACTASRVDVEFQHIQASLITLALLYALALIVLALEIRAHKRKPFPYVN